MNRQVSQTASAPTEILWTFKNILLNEILYFYKMNVSINRDVQTFQRLCRLKRRFPITKS